MSCALIDSNFPSAQLELQLRQLRSKVIYFLPGTKRPRVPFLSGIRYRNLENFRRRTATRWASRRGASVVLFSSGSSGKPKGVVFEWGNIHDIVISVYDQKPPPNPAHRVLNLSPLNWTVGLFHAISLNVNVDVVSRDPLSMTMNQLIEEIRTTAVERVYLGANFARVFAKAAEYYKGRQIETVKKFVIGSGHISWELVNKFTTIFSHDTEFVHSYGSTEAVGMMARSWKMNEIPESGRVPLGYLDGSNGLRLEKTDEESVFHVVATQRIATRYLSESLSIQQFITLPDGTRGWRSGDLVRLEEATNEIYFEGRVDDIVKNSDHLVSLVALEREINSLPGVELSAVRTFPHNGQNLIVAFVQMTTRSPRSEAQIVSTLRKRLPSYSIPHRVILCDQIPLTNRAKADIEQLRALFNKTN